MSRYVCIRYFNNVYARTSFLVYIYVYCVQNTHTRVLYTMQLMAQVYTRTAHPPPFGRPPAVSVDLVRA